MSENEGQAIASINPHIELDEKSPKKAKKITNHVAIILDRSGSMATISKEAVDAVNEQIRTIKKASRKVKTKLTYTTFSTHADEPTLFEKPIKDMAELKLEDYRPDGMTAMLDAVGSMVERFKALPDAEHEDTTFLMIIVSDGQENNSKKYNYEQIAELIKTLQDSKRWTFLYLGANQDLSQVNASMGIHAGNMRAFAASTKGVAQASLHTTRSFDVYYSSLNSVDSFDRDMSCLYSSTAETEEDKSSILGGQTSITSTNSASPAIVPMSKRWKSDPDDKNKSK